MRKILKQLKNQKKIVGLYCDRDDTEVCYNGYIIASDKEYVLFSRITSDGISDGYMLKSCFDICHVETESPYLKKIEKLYHLRSQSHPSFNFIHESDLIVDILKTCEKLNFVVSLNITEDDEDYPLVGFISTKGKMIEVKELDQCGNPAGCSYVNLHGIFSIEIEGLYEESRHILYNHLKNQQ